ncbi:tetratricopeptide repeat protein [Sphaerisporangium rufum]|uniref:tetratricopeptide repeat protein n=1 Tax=Sphaerisporangium rufum TaxID=1381558 RepID=UPI00194E2952|nr:sel1 repeat family protein [Sphaerisporangium rufum]
MPRLFLEEAAAGYLSDEQHDLLADNWLEQAFAYLTDPLPCRGARAPLTRIKNRPGPSTAAGQHEDEPSYQLADYLEQHGAHARRRKCPPAGFWESAARHASATDQTALAKAAHSRGRYRQAAILWHRAADAGDTFALDCLAQMRAQAGDWEEAGDHQEAERLYQLAADAGDTFALSNVAEIREQAGDRQGAEQFYQLAADAGDTSALWALARMREQVGDGAQAERLARIAADAEDPSALHKLAHMREVAGDRREAERLYRLTADAGAPLALKELAGLRQRAGDEEAGAHLVRFGLEADGRIADPW